MKFMDIASKHVGNQVGAAEFGNYMCEQLTADLV